ncbi:MAG: hypothetical protein IJ060_06430 [Oscillospiraceae bacterium]|nr:hypothetical protein [Oscillospiraceae bacterium]
MQKLRTLSLLTALLTLMLCLSGCGKGENPNAGAGHSFSYTLVGNPDTLDPQLAQNASAKTVLANLFEGLMVLAPDGSIQNGVADSYTVSDDGLHYVFHLRENCYWYNAFDDGKGFREEDPIPVTADDFVFAFQRLFDPVYASPMREAFYCIQYAKYAADGWTSPRKIGVTANSTYELEFTLDYPNAGFLLLLTTTAALPCNQAYFESTKGRYGLDEHSVIGNGSFSMQRWLYDPYGKYNVIQLVRNPLNHAEHRVYPADVNLYIEETDADASKIFTDGSADCYVTTQNTILQRADYTAESAYSLTLGLIVNPESQYAETNILTAMALTLDRDLLNVTGDDIRTASGILPPAVTLLNKSCRELIADAAYQKFDLEEADRLYHKGLRKLKISEPEEGRILCCSGMMDYTVLREALDEWHSELDLHFAIEEVSEQEYESRLAAKDYDFALYAVTGPNQDASSFFSELLADDNFVCSQDNTVRELLEQAARAENRNDCVEIYRKAEEAILSDHCFIPLFYKQRYLICKKGVTDIAFNPFSGQVRFAEAKFFEES